MSRPRLLYLSVNDGTDTRIGKEIATLSHHFDITFIGVRQEDNGPNKLPVAVHQVVVSGRRRGIATLFQVVSEVYRVGPWRFDSVHVVNENLLFALFPLLLGARNVVLDVFDSMFLKNNVMVRMLRWPLQWLAHVIADTVLVTDEDRRFIVPSLLRCNVRVLPNYPTNPGALPPRRIAAYGDALKIFFSGSLAAGRGIPFLEALLDASPAVQVVAAGWVYDDAAKRLCARGHVTYLGVVTATDAAKIARECDYILCLYSPEVPNNIHASPNKIYDAALIGVPVIINAEVKAAGFVKANGLGVVLPSYACLDPETTLRELMRRRNEFRSLASNFSPYTWESVEATLLDAHLN